MDNVLHAIEPEERDDSSDSRCYIGTLSGFRINVQTMAIGTAVSRLYTTGKNGPLLKSNAPKGPIHHRDKHLRNFK